MPYPVSSRAAPHRRTPPGVLPALLPERRPRIGSVTQALGLATHYHDRGEGAPVVLLHGNGGLGEEILGAFPDVPGLRWIAPDRPGYGFSEPLPPGCADPISQAAWIADFLIALGLERAHLVSHSIAAGSALVLAGAMPDRIARLTLIAPFCRPTPQRWMPGLRLATAPLVGPLVRRLVVPPLVRAMRGRLIAKIAGPAEPPPWLRDFPVSHAVRPEAVRTMGAELGAFNAGMERIQAHLRLSQPVTVLHGAGDRTADPAWHLPWLAERSTRLTCRIVPGAGHALHHQVPGLALDAIRQAA
jgi:pimeloyl-ACP methyl ester carboxylesterase